MKIEYYKEYSPALGRDMEFKAYGHAGKPVLAVPCQNGRYFDWEGFDMLDTLGDYLEDGKIQLFTVDTIDSETVSAIHGNPYSRVRLHEQWYRYVVDELVPRIHEISGSSRALLSTGFSMGAYHAANCRTVMENRAFTTRELQARGFAVVPSLANFVFARLPGTEGRWLYDRLRERGVLVRHFDKPGIRDYLRITIGSQDQMEALLAALDAIRKE